MAPPRSDMLKRLWLPTLLLAGLGLFFGLGGQEYFGWQAISGRYAALKGIAEANPVLAASAFLLLYVLSVSFSLPVALPLTLTGGALFGWPAAGLVLVGATAGAAVVFIAAGPFSPIWRGSGPDRSSPGLRTDSHGTPFRIFWPSG